ncbi:hypothetical protein K469DRAFT_786934 [Zopfia rhizophila CBS 207.26]|uniref:Uncharacterized protein n=1 Tax=Zopfia rhizophila CBS 207.26 TaxID=1314779 RepID=A0A6A6DY56_9PEZI|nr:hypothetical protein K469DRAFT_786934 [Zopfia rhizophila CBS 207.26]
MVLIPLCRDMPFSRCSKRLCDKCAGPGAHAALVSLSGVGYSISTSTLRAIRLTVHASTRAWFEEAYRDITDRLELPGRDNLKINVLRLVRNWLCDEINGQWMMVLDNVNDVETFFLKSSESSSASLAAYLP